MAGAGYYAGRLRGLNSLSERMRNTVLNEKTYNDMQNDNTEVQMKQQRHPIQMEQDEATLDQTRASTQGTDLLNVERQMNIRLKQNEMAQQEYENNLIQRAVQGAAPVNELNEKAASSQNLAATNREIGTGLLKVDPKAAQKYFENADKLEKGALDSTKAALELKTKQVNQAGQILLGIENQDDWNAAIPELASVNIQVPKELRNWNDANTQAWIKKQAARSPDIRKEFGTEISRLNDQKKIAEDATVSGRIADDEYHTSLGERLLQIKDSTKSLSRGGAINQRYDRRIMNAGAQASQAIANIAKLPLEHFSIDGFKTGKHGALEATKDMLVGKTTTSDNRTYDKLMAGISRQLATLETYGLAPSGTFEKSFEALKAKPEDDVKNRLINMAEMRQIIDTTLGGFDARDDIPEKQQAAIKAMITKVDEAVPYTVEDILELESNTMSGDYTLGNLIRQKGVKGSEASKRASQFKVIRD